MGLYSFIRRNVFWDSHINKYVFRGKEFKRSGQAQKAARKAFEQESKK